MLHKLYIGDLKKGKANEVFFPQSGCDYSKEGSKATSAGTSQGFFSCQQFAQLGEAVLNKVGPVDIASALERPRCRGIHV